MPNDTPLIATIVSGLVLAFAFGAVAHRFRISPIAGYLLAGVLVGPHTPGFVADTHLAAELAEIGVILLMFGVGLHFSLKELLSVRAIAIPGAIVQIAVATSLGAALAFTLGWGWTAGIVFGLALSVASTVVLLRELQEKRILKTDRGRIAVGWLIVEDIAMILALVLIPSFADAAAGAGQSMTDIATALGVTFAKLGIFIVVMVFGGRLLVPRILHFVAHLGSRELFRLAVLAIALGMAFGAAKLFGVSFALGAFFAGMVLAESELSQRATEETLPLRDAFAVLFFVSVGMLFDPMVLLEQPLAVIAAVAIVIFGKSLAAFAIVRLFRHPNGTALTISASLAQIGEFSFMLANLAVALNLLPDEGRDLILAAAIVSILLNPVLFALAESVRARRPAVKPEAPRDMAAASPASPPPDAAPGPAPMPAPEAAAPVPAPTPERPPIVGGPGHAVIVGFGRVGSTIAGALPTRRGLVVVEEREGQAEAARAAGFVTIQENATVPEALDEARIASAGTLFVAIPDVFEAGTVVDRARHLNPQVAIIARAHSDEETAHLKRLGATVVILGETEIGLAMAAAMSAAPQP